MREAAIYDMGGQFHMEMVRVDQHDASLSQRDRDGIRLGFIKPYDEWRVISTNKDGKSCLHLRFATEAACDAAMDELHRSAAASNERLAALKASDAK